MRPLALLASLLGACSREAPTPTRVEAAAAAAVAEPEPAALPVALPSVTVEVLEPGAEPRRALRFRAEPDDRTLELELESTLGLDLGVTALPATKAPPLRLRLRVETRPAADGTALQLSVTQAGLARASGDPALAALLEQVRGFRADVVVDPRGIPLSIAAAGTSAGEQILREALLATFVPLPDEPIGVGAVWRIADRPVVMGRPVEQELRAELTSIEGDTMEIALTAERHAAGSAPAPSPLDELHGRGSGRMTFSLAGPGPRTARLESKADLAHSVTHGEQRQQVRGTMELWVQVGPG